jgi:hypothetical protein
MHARLMSFASLPILFFSLHAHAQAICDGANVPISGNPSSTLHTALGSLKVKVEAQGQTVIAKPEVIDITKNLYAILSNTQSPQYSQVSQDFTAAYNLMGFIVGHPLGVITEVGVSAPVSISTSPNTYTQLGTLLAQNKGLSLNSKYFILSMIEAQLSNQWKDERYRKATLDQTLTEEFTALKNPLIPAGLCGPIHTMGAFVAKNLGLGEVGMIGTDWKQDGSQTVGHVNAISKDPSTGKFVFTNYGDLAETQSTTLSIAAMQAARNLSPYTSSVDVETNTISNHPHEHLMEPELAKNLTGAINRTSDANQPAINVTVGTLRNDLAFQHKMIGNDQNKINVFAVGEENRQQPGAAVQAGAIGIGGIAQKTVALGKSTSLTGKANLEMGMFDVHDQTPAGDASVAEKTRNVSGYIATTDEQAKLAWNKGKNKGDVAVDAQIKEVFYGLNPSAAEAGSPYNRLRVSASEQVAPGVIVHAKSDSFLYTKSFSDQVIVLHPLQQNVGVTVQKDLGHGKIAVNNSVDAYAFGAVNSGAVGLRDESAVSVVGNHNLTYTAYGEVAANINHSGDAFSDHPTTGLIGVSVDKQFSRVDLQGSYTQSLNSDKIFDGMSEGALNPTLADTEARSTFGVTLRFKTKN